MFSSKAGGVVGGRVCLLAQRGLHESEHTNLLPYPPIRLTPKLMRLKQEQNNVLVCVIQERPNRAVDTQG